jgi:hypothetical protein
MLPDIDLARALLNDEQQLHMLEKRAPMNREMRAYRCYIAPIKQYPTHAANENNIVYASWLFYQYFEGVITEGIIPCVLVRPFKTYTTATFHADGRDLKRQWLDVLMDFTTEESLQEVRLILNEECTVLGPKCLQTRIHAIDAKQMCRFFQYKHGKPAEIWKRKQIHTPELCSVSCDCSH